MPPEPAFIPHEGIHAIAQNPNDWNGDAIAVGAGDGIQPNPPGVLIPPSRQYEENAALHARAGMLAGEATDQQPDFDIEFNARYVGAQNRLIAGWFGEDAITSVEEGTTQVGTEHLLTIEDKLTKHFTYAGKGGDIANCQVDHHKVEQIVMAWTSPGRLVVTANLFGRERVNNSTINDNAALGAVTVATPRVHLVSKGMVFRAAAFDAVTELAPTDRVPISAATLTLTRNLAGPVTDGNVRDEPYGPANGWTGTMEWTTPRWANVTFEDAHDDGTLLMADWSFVSAKFLAAAATTTYSWTTFLPQGELTDYQYVDEGAIGEQCTLTLEYADVLAAGMLDSLAPHMKVVTDDALAYVA